MKQYTLVIGIVSFLFDKLWINFKTMKLFQEWLGDESQIVVLYFNFVIYTLKTWHAIFDFILSILILRRYNNIHETNALEEKKTGKQDITLRAQGMVTCQNFLSSLLQRHFNIFLILAHQNTASLITQAKNNFFRIHHFIFFSFFLNPPFIFSLLQRTLVCWLGA